MTDTGKADPATITLLWEDLRGWTQSVVAAFSWSKIREKVKIPGWLHQGALSYLHIRQIRGWIGLPTASLIAFFIGLGCVLGAALQGLLTAKTLVDWQAIQFYRAEWLLAATASFVAGILLKKSSSD